MCTLYSTLPNELTAAINHERMPVLLTFESEWMTWLTGPPDEAVALCRTHSAEGMRIVGSGLKMRDSLVVRQRGSDI